MTDCIFCKKLSPEQILFQSQYFQLVWDIDPIQTGHLLLISKAHHTSIADCSTEELNEFIYLQSQLVTLLEETLPISGVTCVLNDKDLKDPHTHFHLHLIPRKAGDGFWDSIRLEPLHYPLAPFLTALSQWSQSL